MSAARLLPVVILMGLALGGCKTTAELRAEQDALDDATCQSYGAKKGSDAYVRCRTDLQRNRTLEMAAIPPPVIVSPGFSYGWGAYGWRYGLCRPTPFGVRC